MVLPWNQFRTNGAKPKECILTIAWKIGFVSFETLRYENQPMPLEKNNFEIEKQFYHALVGSSYPVADARNISFKVIFVTPEGSNNQANKKKEMSNWWKIKNIER